MSRFDYVRYDEVAQVAQAGFKAQATAFEAQIHGCIKSVRAKENALRCLEETYMWIGKGLRDDQERRQGNVATLSSDCNTERRGD